LFISIVAVSIGIIIQEGRRQRWQSERYLKESITLSERNRIARELHDTVLKTLQGLSLEARALENRTAETTPSVKETAQYIQEVCSLTSKEIREVILDLRTENENTGISSQISKMLKEWSATAGINAGITELGQDVILPPETNRHLRNIVSEMLTNIQRHASASGVQVAVNILDDTLDIEIGDNGRGIGRNIEDMQKFVAEGRLGIAGMKERAEIIGGRLSFSSDQGGTIIRLTMPVSL
jgi:signal transduction histidine kinase